MRGRSTEPAWGGVSEAAERCEGGGVVPLHVGAPDEHLRIEGRGSRTGSRARRALRSRAALQWGSSPLGILAPVLAGLSILLLADPMASSAGRALVVAGALFVGHRLVRAQVRPARHLKLARGVEAVAGPLLGGLLVLGLDLGVGAGVDAAPLLLAVASGVVGIRLECMALDAVVRQAPVRIALVGDPDRARALQEALAHLRARRHQVVGYIASRAQAGAAVGTPCLGPLGELAEIVERDDIQLLVLADDGARDEVFERVVDGCLDRHVRLVGLPALYEEIFGCVPTAEINATWFERVMHPVYQTGPCLSKRTLDVILASVLLVLLVPVGLVLLLFLTLEGGAPIYGQDRIGEGGRPFRILKLRTMRRTDDVMQQWAAIEDARVTRLGRMLRATHIDELPQLINVLRGEMTLVGPRPEQPAFVERLEQILPYYHRRHLVRPGITGWAQVRCGYAGSEIGSAWKLSHDLYYIEHRSTALDLVILIETLRTVVAGRFDREPDELSFVVRRLQESPASGAASLRQ